MKKFQLKSLITVTEKAKKSVNFPQKRGNEGNNKNN